MSKELEIEFKTLLTKDEYIKLCEKFKDCKRNLQINYYFDTSRFTLKASDIGLRVRMLDKDKYIVTLKRKKDMFYKKLMKILTRNFLINFYQLRYCTC
ncbi:MAG: CYTH domain-containing protein [Christensenellales bacterium]